MATKKPIAAKKVAPAKKVVKPVVAKKVPVKKVPAAKKVAPKAPAKKADTKPAAKTRTKANPAKAAATAKGEPWVSVIQVELDPDNIGNGAFELDWNEKFIVQLVKAGYQSKPNEAEDVIVDRWFQDVCKNVVAENYEQWEANQPMDERLRVIGKRDLGDGRTEVS
jgi:hypothetical protein